MRRYFAPLLAVLLLVAIGGAIWQSNRAVVDDKSRQQQQRQLQAQQVRLRGLIGSEKEDFFADPRVQKALASRGITVTVEKAGSRAIVHGFGADKGYDFGFPSGAPAGAQLRAQAKAAQTFHPFYTPMVLASWKPVAQILVANGIARDEGGTYYVVDLPKLLQLIETGKRWRDLREAQAFSTGKSVLIHSTDVRTSNSAAMYLALASYVANDQQVVQSQQDVDRVMPKVAPLFLRQGLQESSSAGPFEDYLALGMGKAPLLIAYESQMVEFWLRHPQQRKEDMVMLYPRPTVYSKHVLVPFTPGGVRLGEALEQDPQLRELAHEYGFRTAGETKGPETWEKLGLRVPATLVDVVDPPSQEWLERMIVDIEQRTR